MVTTRDHRGHYRMAFAVTTTYAINAYHPSFCEFESRSGRGVQHYMIKYVSDLRHVGGFVESGVKHHQTNKQANVTTKLEIHICISILF